MQQNALAQATSLTQVIDFGHNPGKLQMLWYKPQVAEKHMPLVVVLHGCTQTGEDVTSHAGWNKMADSLGFALLYPQTGPFNNISRCFNWFKPEHTTGKAGESASIKNMIDYLINQGEIDSSKVFITGLSAGGAMAVAMLAQFPETFKAGAVFTGAAYGIALNAKDASRAMRGKIQKTPEEWGELVKNQNLNYTGKYPRISVYQGLKDGTVNPENAHQIVSQWAFLHQAKQIANDGLCANNKNVACSAWANSKGETVVKLYLFANLGHAISIDPGTEINRGGKVGRYFKDTGFHSTWQCVQDFGLTK
jgi:poly(hydroxyalkanoate) depolymerase family esterase